MLRQSVLCLIGAVLMMGQGCPVGPGHLVGVPIYGAPVVYDDYGYDYYDWGYDYYGDLGYEEYGDDPGYVDDGYYYDDSGSYDDYGYYDDGYYDGGYYEDPYWYDGWEDPYGYF